jgi:outer membrane protein
MINKKLVQLIAIFWSVPIFGQDVFDIKQCVDFALKNHETIKNSQLDIQIAKADIKEIRGMGLPQLSATGDFNYFYKIPTQMMPDFITGAVVGTNMEYFNLFPSKDLPETAFFPVQFGTKFNTSGGLTLSQLIFNGSYFVGLKAAKTYSELVESSLHKTKLDVVESVSKAYYNVLITNERVNLIQSNLNILDTLKIQTQALYEAGFVDRIELSKVEVNKSNLEAELNNFKTYQDLAYQLLKFQMGMNLEAQLQVADNIQDIQIPIFENVEVFNPKNIAEYQLLEVQKKLYELDRKRNLTEYMPTISGFANHAYNAPTQNFNDMFQSKDNWFPTGILGVRLNMPIFSGFQKHYKVQKSNLSLLKVENDLALFSRASQFKFEQSVMMYKTLTENLESQKRNMSMAKEIYQITLDKNKVGTSSLLEVTSAFNEYRIAVSNYYNSLYELIIAKIDIDKSSGKLNY